MLFLSQQVTGTDDTQLVISTNVRYVKGAAASHVVSVSASKRSS
jgi:hypothetical protein